LNYDCCFRFVTNHRSNRDSRTRLVGRFSNCCLWWKRATSTGTVKGEMGRSTIVASDGRTTDGSLAGGFVDMEGKPGLAEGIFQDRIRDYEGIRRHKIPAWMMTGKYDLKNQVPKHLVSMLVY
jgi:hypothetical protein